jgi:hypothetical protein
MQTCSSLKSPSNEAPPLPPAKCGQKAVNPATEPAKKPVEKCHWTPKEEECLILFLVSRKSEAGDGGSFKMVTWTAAVQQMAKFPPTKNLVKNLTACSSKYGHVCTLQIATQVD